MTAPLSPSQVLDQIERLAITPLGTLDIKDREDLNFERKRQIAELAADLRLELARRGIE